MLTTIVLKHALIIFLAIIKSRFPTAGNVLAYLSYVWHFIFGIQSHLELHEVLCDVLSPRHPYGLLG